MNFDYTVTTKKSFDEAVSAVEKATKAAGFRVLYIHDVANTLAEKDFILEPFKIIEICHAKSAYTVLQADLKIGLCLPCKINVYQKDQKTFISGMRPIVLSQFFPNANLGSLPMEIDALIKAIIDKSSIVDKARLTCPKCQSIQEVEMSTEACQYFYKCQKCNTLVKPKAGDCCVFCSYADTKCPSKQL